MKWFKHQTNALSDPFIVEMIDKYGGDGYMIYFGLVEMMAEKFTPEGGGRCTLPVSFLRKNLQISGKKLSKFLNIFSKKEKIFSKIVGENGDEIELYCPKLRDVASDWAKRQIRENSGV